jgi:hypothetical protein
MPARFECACVRVRYKLRIVLSKALGGVILRRGWFRLGPCKWDVARDPGKIPNCIESSDRACLARLKNHLLAELFGTVFV